MSSRIVVEHLENRRLLHAGQLDTSFGTSGIGGVDFDSGNDRLVDLIKLNSDKMIAVGYNETNVRRFKTRYGSSAAFYTTADIGTPTGPVATPNPVYVMGNYNVQQTVGAEVHLAHVCWKSHHREDDVGVSREVGRGRGPGGAAVEKRRRLLARARVDVQPVSLREQVPAHRPTHDAGADPTERERHRTVDGLVRGGSG